jgi:hypothetical protein
MSDINLSGLENTIWLLIAAAVVIGGGFLWIVWRYISKRRGNGRKG